MSEVITREPPWDISDPNDRLIMESFDADGNLVERYEGPTARERWENHLNGQCHWLCEFCYHEAEVYAKENGINWGTNEDLPCDSAGSNAADCNSTADQS